MWEPVKFTLWGKNSQYNHFPFFLNDLIVSSECVSVLAAMDSKIYLLSSFWMAAAPAVSQRKIKIKYSSILHDFSSFP